MSATPLGIPFWRGRGDRTALRADSPHPDPSLERYWTLTPSEVARRLHTGPDGLTSAEAARRLRQYGPNTLLDSRPRTRVQLLLNQVRSPLLLLLVLAAAASLATSPARAFRPRNRLALLPTRPPSRSEQTA